MKKALVTGGAGFIGSHLAKRLLKEKWQVDVMDNLSTGYKENVPSGVNFKSVDLSKDNFVKELPNKKYDVVFHLAAQSSGEISFDDPEYDLKTNCLSTVQLLDWCLKKGIKRFIYTSSMSIYGDQKVQPVKETTAPLPKSFYGIGKLASEKYLRVYEKLGVHSTSLRLFNVYGPGQNMENLRQGMVSIYMAYIVKGQPVLVKGSPKRFRDIVYIDDVIEAYMKCWNNPKTFGKVYNVATGKKTTVKELLKAELKAFGYNPAKYPVKFKGSTPGDTFGIYAEVSAIKKDTGWKPKVNLREGLKRMSAWARSL